MTAVTWLIRRIPFAVLSLLCVVVAIYAFGYLYRATVDPLDAFQGKFGQDNWWVPIHMFGAATALLVMPLQLGTWLRQRFNKVHRILGLCYVFAVGAGALSGFVMALDPVGGLPVTLGFGTLSIVWAGATMRSFMAIIRGDVSGHRRWMMRSAALTFAAVTLRLYLGLGSALGIEFITVYQVSSWLSWTINLLVWEAILRFRLRRSPTPATNMDTLDLCPENQH